MYDLLKDIHSKNIIEQYKQLSLVLGKKITYTLNNTTYVGTALDINESGNLIITDGKNIYNLDCGEVSIKLQI